MFRLSWIPALLALSVLSACGGDNNSSSGSSSSNSSSSTSSSSSSSSSSNSSSSSSSSSTSSSSSGGSVGALKISEIVAKSEIATYINGNDWIELHNTGSVALNLAQFSLADAKGEQWPLPSVPLQAGQYFVVAAADKDEPPTDGTAYVPFKLAKEDTVALYTNGQKVDSVTWLDGDAKEGRSYGLLEGKTQTLYPTPGYANAPYTLFARDKVFTVRVTMKPADWSALQANAQAEQWYPADFELNGAKIANVGFRTKGQSSLSMMAQIPASSPSKKRYGFKIDFNQYQEQKFMGMKMLVLGNGFADPTMLRDVVSYQLFKDVGMPSPEASFVDLWVAGEHMGVYSLIEAIDGEFVEKYFTDDKANDLKGDLYKAEVLNALTWKGNAIGSYTGLELKTNEETIGTPSQGAALLRFLDTLNNGANPLEHVDTEMMVRYFAALALTGNTDSYPAFTANNFYMYEHRSIDAFAMLPWDFNLGLGVVGSVLEPPGVTIGDGFIVGNTGGGGGFGGGGGGGFGGGDGGTPVSCDTVTHLIDTPKSTTGPRPLLTKLLADPQLLQRYRQHIKTLIDGPFREDNIRREILRWADLLDPYVQADPTKFFTYTEWRHNLTNDMPSNSNRQGGRGGNFFGPATGLIRFIEDRVANVRRQLNGEISSSSTAGTACPAR
jgi:spore coat protein CotH